MRGFHHYHGINRNRRVRLQDTGRFTSCTSDRNVWLYRGSHHFEAALNKPTRAKNIVRITRSWDFGAQRPGINIFKQKKVCAVLYVRCSYDHKRNVYTHRNASTKWSESVAWISSRAAKSAETDLLFFFQRTAMLPHCWSNRWCKEKSTISKFYFKM